MAGEWREAALGDVIELKRGFDLPQQDRVRGSFPIVSSSGITDHHCVAKVKGPGVVTGRYGTIGEVFFVREDFWPLNTTLYVLDFKGNDPRFVSYLLRTVNFLAYSDKAAVPGVNRNHLHSARVFVPTDVSEQQAIARALGTLDDKIELNCQMNETLEGMARALFKSWFVDFDPVRAKVKGRASGLPERIASFFPNSFAPSEKGEIPSGWQSKPIGELGAVNGGSTPSTKEPSYWDGGTHFWATPKDLSTLKTPVLLDTERKITDAGLAQIASGLLPEGTVLMSSRAPIGYLAVAEVPVAINQGFIAMRAAAGVSNLFLLRWAEWAHDLIVSHANGSTFLEISKSSFRPILVATPPDTVMKEFDRLARPLHSRIVYNERASRTLAKLRDALLPKLVSGELRIPSAERIIGGQV